MTVRGLICFGYGYVAKELSRLLQTQGDWSILGTSRNPRTNAVDDTISLQGFPDATWTPPDDQDAWLISIPPNDLGCPVFQSFSDRVKNVGWIGYLSSSGVYGDLGGKWAFEETPTNALSIEAKRRVVAEYQWLENGAHIFRLPGIYGPGRSAFDRLKTGRARRIIKEGQVFSRAHVEDIATVLAASIKRPNPGRIYNVSDDRPCPASDVFAYAASLNGTEPPPEIAFEDANLPDAAQRFYAECKRLPNSRAKAELGWRPKYPDYVSGLEAILRQESND